LERRQASHVDQQSQSFNIPNTVERRRRRNLLASDIRNGQSRRGRHSVAADFGSVSPAAAVGLNRQDLERGEGGNREPALTNYMATKTKAGLRKMSSELESARTSGTEQSLENDASRKEPFRNAKKLSEDSGLRNAKISNTANNRELSEEVPNIVFPSGKDSPVERLSPHQESIGDIGDHSCTDSLPGTLSEDKSEKEKVREKPSQQPKSVLSRIMYGPSAADRITFWKGKLNVRAINNRVVNRRAPYSPKTTRI
jgi:hypothetical protein